MAVFVGFKQILILESDYDVERSGEYYDSAGGESGGERSGTEYYDRPGSGGAREAASSPSYVEATSSFNEIGSSSSPPPNAGRNSSPPIDRTSSPAGLNSSPTPNHITNPRR